MFSRRRHGQNANSRPLYQCVVVLCLCLTIRAQDLETISCLQQPWTLLSSTGATPCATLVRVMDLCSQNTALIIPLINTASLQTYLPPSGTDNLFTHCQCTDIAYNLFSACAACQGGNWSSHDQWFQSCSQRNNATLDFNSPEITPWMDTIYVPIFDVARALAINNNNTLPPLASTSTTSAPTASATQGTLGGPASTSAKKSNTGAIIGGVVGGVALLILVLVFLFLIVRKKKSRRVPPSAEFMKYAQTQGVNNATVPLTHMNMTEEEYRASQARNSLANIHTGAGVGYGASRGSLVGASRHNTEEDAPPAFTTGLFKDPIFEKGVALNLAGAASATSASPTGHNPLTQTPVAYSPATPSTLFSHAENQRLIHGRQMSN